MADKKVEYEIKIIGDALERLKQITGQAEELGGAAERSQGKLAGIGRGLVMFNQALELVNKATERMREFTDANRAQQEAEAKLAQVMRNTMGASAAEIGSIKELASVQQKLGVIGDEVQLAGAQELGTYLSKTESLKRLMPVMNDMLAQQYGLNASQEQSVQIAAMMGKVMDGQVGALSRYGYKFDEVQEKILKYGTEEERVATLAEVIGQSVGGMNAALAATPEGRLQQVANDMGDIKERVGAIWVRVQSSLIPATESLMAIANGLIDVVQAGWPVWIAAAVGVLIAVTKIKKKLEETSLAALLTGGSFTTMGAIAKAACRSVSTAIMSIPIAGWIAAAITLVIGVFTTLWNKCEAFRGFLTGLWDDIKEGFHTVLNCLAKPLNKIIEVWNKITGGSVGAFRFGYEKGAGKVRENKGIAPAGLPGQGDREIEGPGLGSAADSMAAKGAESAVTGGTRNTTVNINLGKMVENIVFNGTLGENAQELERRIEEILTRTLMMAASIS